MNYKSFLHLSVPMVILTAFVSSYAMDLGENKNEIRGSVCPSPPIFAKELVDTCARLDILAKAQYLYAEAKSMHVPLDKATQYGEVINLLQPYVNDMKMWEQNVALKDLLSPMIKILADSYHQKGEILYQIGCSLKPTPQHIDHLCQASSCLKNSYKLYYKLHPHDQNVHSSFLNFTTTLYHLGMSYCLSAEKENDPFKKISTLLKSLKVLKDSYALNPSSEKKEWCYKSLMIALKEGSCIYLNSASGFYLFQEAEPMRNYQYLIKNVNLLKDILDIFENYLIDPFVPYEWTVVEHATLQQLCRQRRGIARAHPSPQLQQKLPVLNPQDCVPIISSTYCGMLTRASHTIKHLQTDHPTLSTMYQEKGQEHLDLAFQLYKEKIYKDEYAHDAERADAFISARLEALAGNDEPIKTFYCTLRHDYHHRQRQVIARQIKAEQEERRIHEEKEHELTEQKAQRQQSRLKRLDLSSGTTTTSLDPLIFESGPEEKYKAPTPRVKSKTHGTPSSPPSLETKEAETLLINKKTILLEPDNYYVYQSLTGEIYNKNITLKQVLHLLTNLQCTLSLGKGSHNKATAPNNHIWTIPPSWDGPIPAYYHGQLMEFLLHGMGVVSGELEVQKGAHILE